MTATQKFIEDAIKGGWGSHLGKKWRIAAGYIEHMQTYYGKGVWERVIAISTALLDPLAWQAVGKTRGWVSYSEFALARNPEGTWRWQMHRFIDHLADGLTIEEALTQIL